MDEECRKRILSEDYADFMIDYGDSLDDIKKRFDVCYDRLINETANVYIRVTDVPDNFIHLYGFGAFPNCYGLLDIASTEASGITKLRSIPALDLRGRGVLIGIVDTGIDYTHEAFRYEDGSSKILSIWDQTVESETGRPEGFLYGTEYTRTQINEALGSGNPLSVVPSTDEDGHGTFLAGIAAGRTSEENQFTGIVPDSEIVVVKLKQAKKYTRNFWKIPENAVCFQKNDFISGLKYLMDTAKKVNMPISIIIGIGTSQGAHDDRGVLSTYLTEIARESGVSVAIAAGNEGNTKHHYSGTVDAAKNMDTMELNVGPGESGFSMEIWGQTPTSFSIDMISPSGEYVPRIPARINESREVRFIFEKTVIYVDYQLTEAQSGNQLILLRFEDPAEGVWRFRIVSSGNLTLNYQAWLPISQFLTEETYFIKPDPYYTLTSPANVVIPIVATAYDYRNQSLYASASRGYTRNELISPTLAAPGVNLIGPAAGDGYHTASGTSLAAAHTGGIAAMFLEWGIVRGNYNQISTIEISNLLIRGAKRRPNVAYPNKEWGYGIIDLYNAYNSLRSSV